MKRFFRAASAAYNDCAVVQHAPENALFDAKTLETTFPEPIANRKIQVEMFLVHLAEHLAYHLGQIDYHRRAVTGDAKGVDAISVRELPEAP